MRDKYCKFDRISALLILLVFLQLMLLTNQATTLTLTPVPTSVYINAIATYSYSISFDTTAPITRSNLLLKFPSSVTLFSSITPTTVTASPITLLSTDYIVYPTNSSILITKTVSGNIVFTISNVKNPSSAIQSQEFTITSNNSIDNIGQLGTRYVQYLPGSLKSCVYTFSGTTQQTSCTLIVAIILGDALPSGSSNIVISYPSQWANLPNKYLTYGSTISCLYSTDNSSYTYSGSCTFDTANIYVAVTTISEISANKNVYIKITGVNCPPTQTTVTTSDYKVTTKDASNNKIDQMSFCSIDPVTVTSQSGSFTQAISISSETYPDPYISFTNSIPVTLKVGDTMEMTNGTFLTGCSNNFIISKNVSMAWGYTTTTLGIRVYTTNFPNDNTFYNSQMTLYMDCDIVPPLSAQPQTFFFTFKRNGFPYLNLTAILIANAVLLPASNFNITLQTKEAVVKSIYTFTMLTSYPLSNQGVVDLFFPLEISFLGFSSSTSCSAKRDGQTTIILNSCNYSASATNTLSLFFADKTSFPANTTISITINGLNNSRVPNYIYNFGADTYYDWSQPLSLVEYNSVVQSITYTQYITNQLSLNPSQFQVFQTTNFVVNYKNQVELPSGIILTFTFPTDISSVTFNFGITVNSSSKPVTNNPIATNPGDSIIVSFIYSYTLPIGSIIVVPLTMRTPVNLGIYASITFSASKDNQIFEKSDTSLPVMVTKASPISFSISLTGSSTNQQTGSYCTYQFTMTSFIPHTSIFYIQIQIPNDTTFLSSYNSMSGKCIGTGVCNSVIGVVNSSYLNLTMLNPSNSSTFTFSLGTFVNPRSVGTSLPWLFKTRNDEMQQIGSGVAYVTINNPNVLTAAFSLSNNYYRGNTQLVQFTITPFNRLIAGDYIILSIGSDVYTKNPNSAVSCPSIIYNCTVDSSSTAGAMILIIRSILNATQLGAIVNISIDGLLSSLTTPYAYSRPITVGTFTSLGAAIDSGTLTYNVSCGDKPALNCKICTSNGTCITCYTDEGYYQLNGRCTNNCSKQTQYSTFGLNTTCTSCVSNCYTCASATLCLSCVTNYYLFMDSTCRGYCNITNGYYLTNSNCFPCANSDCLVCTNGGWSGCNKCNVGVLDSGDCKTSCSSSNTYILNAKCNACDTACDTCTGQGSTNCIRCSPSYYNITQTKTCDSSCPTGTAPLPNSQLCGCTGDCLTCNSSNPSYCLSCNNTKYNLAYLGQCLAACPSYSYQSGKSCIPCSYGCITCNVNTCISCAKGKYSHQNSCVSDCNTISQQYDIDINDSKCILCPNGCDTCSNFSCTSCLSGFTLSNLTCLDDCIILGNCQDPVPDKVLPLPGLITAAVWIILVVVLKFIISKMYLPYSMIYCLCIIQIILVIITVGAIDKSSSSNSLRLLIGKDYSYRSNIKGLLIASIALNYIMNILYIIIFIKYLKQFIPTPRQIDYIVNGAVLILGTITNYRFGLLAFSKMFPKPEVAVDMPSRLTPINYLCITSIILDVLPLAGAGLLAYNETPLTNLFMLAVDILIILLINVAITIWMVAMTKPDSYFESDTKKYSAQDQFRTQENALDEKNMSHGHLAHAQVSYNDRVGSINDDVSSIGNYDFRNSTNFDMKHSERRKGEFSSIVAPYSDVENNPLPLISKVVHPNLQTIKITSAIKEENDIDDIILFDEDSISPKAKKVGVQSQHGKEYENKKTKRNEKRPQNQRYTVGDQQNLQRKGKQQAKNFSKEKQIGSSRFEKGTSSIRHTDLQVKRDTNKVRYDSDSQNIDELQEVASDNVMPKNLHPKKEYSKRSETNQPVNVVTVKHKAKGDIQSEKKMMVKKNRVGLFESEKAEEDENEDDLDAIIEKKIKNSRSFHKNQVSLIHQKESQQQYEDISPSFYNIQNQRLDISEYDQTT